MTKQQIFDKVATHLLTQRQVSRDGVQCIYRADNGFRCAIGCLIPDDKYKPNMEGQAIKPLLEQHKDLLGFPIGPRNLKLLKDLQQIHDDGFI